jgi:pSer/pThr/pTyr-binding forkhead associated (FHA) protein
MARERREAMADHTDKPTGERGEADPGADDVNCYLTCFPARPIRLHRERPTTIGRADGNTIVLADTDVSRKHAVVEWTDGRFVVRDLSSRNGVYVNDERVGEKPLASDDRVRVGTRVFTFIRGDEQAVRRLFLKKRQEKHTGATDVFDVESLTRPSAGFAGNLTDFGLAELLQALELGRKTGKVTVVCDQGRGEMHVRDGQVLRATLGEHRNEQAVFQMVGLEAGRFQFENCQVAGESEIGVKTASLLMEGFRLMDESQRGEASVAEPFGAMPRGVESTADIEESERERSERGEEQSDDPAGDASASDAASDPADAHDAPGTDEAALPDEQ